MKEDSGCPYFLAWPNPTQKLKTITQVKTHPKIPNPQNRIQPHRDPSASRIVPASDRERAQCLEGTGGGEEGDGPVGDVFVKGDSLVVVLRMLACLCVCVGVAPSPCLRHSDKKEWCMHSFEGTVAMICMVWCTGMGAGVYGYMATWRHGTNKPQTPTHTCTDFYSYYVPNHPSTHSAPAPAHTVPITYPPVRPARYFDSLSHSP